MSSQSIYILSENNPFVKRGSYKVYRQLQPHPAVDTNCEWHLEPVTISTLQVFLLQNLNLNTDGQIFMMELRLPLLNDSTFTIKVLITKFMIQRKPLH